MREQVSAGIGPEWLTPAEVARRAGLSTKRIFELIRAGELTAAPLHRQRPGRPAYRIRREECARWLASRGIDAKEAFPERLREMLVPLEVAKRLLTISKQGLHRAIKDGRLPAAKLRVGRDDRYYVRVADLFRLWDAAEPRHPHRVNGVMLQQIRAMIESATAPGEGNESEEGEQRSERS